VGDPSSQGWFNNKVFKLKFHSLCSSYISYMTTTTIITLNRLLLNRLYTVYVFHLKNVKTLIEFVFALFFPNDKQKLLPCKREGNMSKTDKQRKSVQSRIARDSPMSCPWQLRSAVEGAVRLAWDPTPHSNKVCSTSTLQTVEYVIGQLLSKVLCVQMGGGGALWQRSHRCSTSHRGFVLCQRNL